MNLEEIRERNDSIAKTIAEGGILQYLKEQNRFISDVEIAARLELSLPLVREELIKLINQNLILIGNQPSQGKLTSGGLQYKWRERDQ